MLHSKEPKKEMVATFKGKRYVLLYSGKTKVGIDGALLMRFDGKRKFWVDSKEVSQIEERRTGEGAAKAK